MAAPCGMSRKSHTAYTKLESVGSAVRVFLSWRSPLSSKAMRMGGVTSLGSVSSTSPSLKAEKGTL